MGDESGAKQADALAPDKTVQRIGRKRLAAGDELLLVALPTATVLLVFGVVEAFTQQRLLFASLASSAYLIYLDPEHATNQIKTLTLSQISAAILGWGSLAVLGPGYLPAALAMIGAIVIMFAFDIVHPPAVSTSLAFAFRRADDSNLWLFVLAVGMVAVLVLLERASLFLIRRARRRAT